MEKRMKNVIKMVIFCLAFVFSRGTGAAFTPVYDDRYNGNYLNYLVASVKYGIPVEWVVSLARIESEHNQNVVSSAGAIGVMQLMPETAADCGADPHVIEENIDCGVRVFSGHVRRYGSIEIALAAYNAGPDNVRRYRGIPPFEETRRYIRKFWIAFKSISAPEGD